MPAIKSADDKAIKIEDGVDEEQPLVLSDGLKLVKAEPEE